MQEEIKKVDDEKAKKKLEKKNKKIYGRRKNTWVKSVEKVIIGAVLRTFYRITFRLDTINQEKVPTNEPIILCANHLNIFDAVGIVLFTKKPIRFIAKYEVF